MSVMVAPGVCPGFAICGTTFGYRKQWNLSRSVGLVPAVRLRMISRMNSARDVRGYTLS